MRVFGFGLLSIALLVSGCREDAFCLNCPTDSSGSSGSNESGSDEGDAAVGGDGDGGAGTSGDGGGGSNDDGGAPMACEPLGDDEICNQIDDDCDGTVDEGFDFTNNPRHCGGCDQVCQ